MKFRFFKIPVLDSVMATDELNAFCAQHLISNIEKHFVAEGENSFWSICVVFLEGQGAIDPIKMNKRNKTIDYKEVLSDDDFMIYSKLRELRKTVAENEGTPPYNVFTNEQLANIVRHGVMNKTGPMYCGWKSEAHSVIHLPKVSV